MKNYMAVLSFVVAGSFIGSVLATETEDKKGTKETKETITIVTPPSTDNSIPPFEVKKSGVDTIAYPPSEHDKQQNVKEPPIQLNK